MLKTKRILIIIILAVLLFLIPNISKAATTTYTSTSKTSTGKTINWSYELDSSGNAVNLTCTNVSSISGTVEIPSKIDDHTVVTIGNTKNSYSKGAFEECSGLTGITVPNTVTTIGYRAFYKCIGLKSVTIPDSVTDIKESAFDFDAGITSITLSKNLSNIGSNAFRGCTGLKSISIPSSVTAIGDRAFNQCTGLKSIKIPDSVTSLGEGAFLGCSGLTSVTLSENLTTIKDQTFQECTGLTSVIIPGSVTTIEGYYSNIYGAFGNCKNLGKVLIPDSVASIGKGAFRDCPKLTIYGNDGQASKQYAEENEVKFDYIKNWDKAGSGSDIAAPIVSDMYVKHTSVSEYWDKTTSTYRVPAKAQIIIVVEFSEEIKGKTAPTLTIKCGVGDNTKLTGGTIAGKAVTYTYTIKSTDSGQVTSVSLTGGDITDTSGNKAELSVKTLRVQYQISDRYVYANGSSTVANQDENNGTQTSGDNQSTNKGQGGSSSTGTTNNEKDNTIINATKLPQTGVTILSLIAISLITIAVISKIKCNKYKDI